MLICRRKKVVLAISLTFLGWISLVIPAQAGPVPISELVNNAGKWNNQSVELTGEAIGDMMRRGDNAWLNVSQDNTVLGLWGRRELFIPVTQLGDYGHRGDTIRALGEFHLACPEHGGDMDVHITRLEVIEPGTKTAHPPKSIHIWLALAGAVTATVLAVVLKVRNRKG